MTSIGKENLDPARFSGLGISFNGKLIGITDVPDSRGDEICQAKIRDLKAAVEASGQHKQKIFINVSLEGIKLIDQRTGVTLHQHSVHKISFVSRDPTDSRAFGYIYSDDKDHHVYFAIKTEKTADGIVLAIQDLFRTVFEQQQREKDELNKPKEAVPAVVVPVGGYTSQLIPPTAMPSQGDTPLTFVPGSTTPIVAVAVPPPLSEPAQTPSAEASVGNLLDFDQEFNALGAQRLQASTGYPVAVAMASQSAWGNVNASQGFQAAPTSWGQTTGQQTWGAPAAQQAQTAWGAAAPAPQVHQNQPVQTQNAWNSTGAALPYQQHAQAQPSPWQPTIPTVAVATAFQQPSQPQTFPGQPPTADMSRPRPRPTAPQQPVFGVPPPHAQQNTSLTNQQATMSHTGDPFKSDPFFSLGGSSTGAPAASATPNNKYSAFDNFLQPTALPPLQAAQQQVMAPKPAKTSYDPFGDLAPTFDAFKKDPLASKEFFSKSPSPRPSLKEISSTTKQATVTGYVPGPGAAAAGGGGVSGPTAQSSATDPFGLGLSSDPFSIGTAPPQTQQAGPFF